ncbi:tRNA lysidine(34) synthetase TilS [Parasphingorhabdus cellanae]|uniref:tRNA(Ile)-lysidine synthase n=1 Tax=Parasphingorhabdus cellanae TaxID=2806553 RepID=A0ABX7T7B4_9SPHN|nr:tRNA lysidine(34) synthetase TilS [Parasphingorhabdus cellanae]QTD57011.1 tRNA lysidine(34) synthetase TilS [Parasphingorhabdus cellanae]
MTGDALIDRFREAVTTLVPDFEDSNAILGLAVSGGPDSLALLLLAHGSFSGRIMAASVNHGLRPAAKDECEFVAKICAERGIPHHILKPSTPIRGSIQAEARKARYSLLNGWMETQNIKWLATAHHADDQLETLIMRILRGSGIDGMSAIRAKRGHIIRPLLPFSKDMLVQFVSTQGVKAIDDPSNRDQNFDRVRVREALSQLSGFDVSLASQSAAALDDARAAVHWMVEELAASHIIQTADGCRLDNHDFPHEIIRRLLLRCLHICDPALSPRGSQLEPLIRDLKQGKTLTMGNILCKGGLTWTFALAPKRNNS